MIQEITNENSIVSDADNSLYSNNDNVQIDDLSNKKQLGNTSIQSNVKVNPQIRLSNYDIKPNQSVLFYARIVSPNATGKGVFKINGITISNTLNVENGIVRYNYTIPTNFGSPTYNLTFVYGGNSLYNKYTCNSTLTLYSNNITPTIVLQNYTAKTYKNVTFKVKINRDATGNVVFKINNNTISPLIKLTKGSASFTYDLNLIPRTYRLSVVYSGSYMYNGGVATSNLIVKKLSSTIVVSNVTSNAGNYTKFTAVAKDENGKPYKNVKVIFKLNGLSFGSNNTNSKGVVTCYYTIPYQYNMQRYTINVTSADTRYIEGNKNSSKLRLTTLTTNTIVVNKSAKYDSEVYIDVTILDYYKNRVQRGNVTLYIDGVEVTDSKYNCTVVNGAVRYKYSLSNISASSFKVDAVYHGNWKYIDSNGTGKITLAKLNTQTRAHNLITKTGKAGSFIADVIDENGNKVNSGNVLFTVQNTFVGKAPVIDGLANYTKVLPLYSAGKYVITAYYQGDSRYYSSNNTNTLNVSRLKTTTKAIDYTGVVGSTIKINVSVVDEDGYNVEFGEVKIYINKTVVGNGTVKNGYAIINYVLPRKYENQKFEYTAVFSQNNIYDTSSAVAHISNYYQNEVYVSPTGNNNNLGDKNHPFKTIAYAVSHTSLLGTVHVAAGTYYEHDIPVTRSVKLIGSGNPIIDGNNKGTVINVQLVQAILTIENMQIINGRSTIALTGGAITSKGTLNIKNVKFINNTASGASSGGAIYSTGYINLTSVTFTNNVASHVNSQGGAIYSDSNITNINSSYFNNNKVTGTNSTGGSAIYSSNGNVLINNTRIINQQAKGSMITGGAIKVSGSDLILINTNITNATSNGSQYTMGGAIGGLGGSVAIINSTLNLNKAYANNVVGGSAVYLQYGNLTLSNANINSNYAKSVNIMGGAVYAYSANSIILNSRFNGNVLTSSTNGFGGAYYQDGGYLTAYSTSFTNNNASGNSSYGGAMYFSGDKIYLNGTTFTGNYLRANSFAIGGALSVDSSDAIITASDFINNKVSASTLGGGAIATTNVLTVSTTNFINNNASNIGNAITGSGSNVVITNNYWGQTTPDWSKLLFNVNTPSSYSKTQFTH